MKLYRLKNRLGHFYVLAKDSGAATKALESHLNKRNYGPYGDRIVTETKLLAHEIDMKEKRHFTIFPTFYMPIDSFLDARGEEINE